MNRLVRCISGLLLISGLFGCEKEIDIPLDEGEQRIVIEAILSDRVDESFILLSKTGSVYDDSGFETISGASVTVTDEAGMSYLFIEDSLQLGRYTSSGFITLVNNKYSLSVQIGSGTFLADCKTFYKPVIDSLSYLEQIGGFGGATQDTNYLVFYNFKDYAQQTNYYRVTAWVNGERDDLYYIFNDELFNGQQYSAPFFGSRVESGDTVFVELKSMDEANYTYLYTLSNNADSGPFSAAPGNPVSNIEGDAIGYFGAYTTDTLTLILP